MATAVEPSSAPSTPRKTLSLPIASLLGAIYVVAVLAVISYLLPMIWVEHVSPRIRDNFLDWVFWLPTLALVTGGLFWFGTRLASDNVPVGTRGGIFLILVTATVIFLIVREFALAFDGAAGQVVGGIIGLVLLFFAVRLFTGPTGMRWMVSLEEQGWFSTHQYKRSLGLRVRRLTILGILLIGSSGAYTLWFQGLLPNQWTMTMPFGLEPIVVMNNAAEVIPALLFLLTLWIAWRAVNVPTFAEFLIATEAEMNKVSWTTRKRLAQDTVVVLITTLLLTIFLLVVDLFWGWLLSSRYVGVLPSATPTPEKAGQFQEVKW
jgi:preprotein translocase SecE subunit